MSRETPDEPAGAEQHWRRLWQKILREPDALPGQGLADKDAAWEKLSGRLNAKPRWRLRITGWFGDPFSGLRIAAACILVVLIPVSRLFHDRDRPGPGRPAAAAQPQETIGIHPPATAGQPQESNAIRMPATAPIVAVPPAVPAPAITAGRAGKQPEKRPVADRLASAGTKHIPAPAGVPPAKMNSAASAAPAVPSASTAPSAAIPAPPALILTESTPPNPAAPPKPAAKKQWKVVDINELEPGNTQPRMVAGRQPRLLRLGPGIGNTGLAEDPPGRGEDSRLKINLSTQNH